MEDNIIPFSKHVPIAKVDRNFLLFPFEFAISNARICFFHVRFIGGSRIFPVELEKDGRLGNTIQREGFKGGVVGGWGKIALLDFYSSLFWKGFLLCTHCG